LKLIPKYRAVDADVFALGVILFTLIFGFFPFEPESVEQEPSITEQFSILRKSKNHDFSFTLVTLLSKMLAKEPS
jgi:serine/threonine protein kinase